MRESYEEMEVSKFIVLGNVSHIRSVKPVVPGYGPELSAVEEFATMHRIVDVLHSITAQGAPANSTELELQVSEKPWPLIETVCPPKAPDACADSDVITGYTVRTWAPDSVTETISRDPEDDELLSKNFALPKP